jgi:hypothetical protein
MTLAAETGANGLFGVDLAVDSTSVYFGYDSALMSVPIHGGPVTTLARLPFNLNRTPIVTSERVVFPVSTGTGTDDVILSVPVAGGSMVTLASVPNGASGFGADSQTVYFIDQQGTKRVPLAGGDVEVITTQVTSANAGGQIAVIGGNLIVAGFTTVTLDAGEITLTLQTGDRYIQSIPTDGGSPTTIATGQPNASFPLACGADICWWSGATPVGVAGTSGPGNVARLAPDGGMTTLPGAPYAPWSFLFDGTDFFETVACDVCFGGPLLRIPASGAPVVTMGAGTYAAVDDTCVYYSTPDGIFSMAKTSGGNEPDGGAEAEAPPIGSVLCSASLGPVDAGTVDAGATQWCEPPHGCEPYGDGWACCFYDAIGNTSCDLIGNADAGAGDDGGSD